MVALAPLARQLLCAAVLLSNVGHASAVRVRRHTERAASAAELRSVARASRLRREVGLIKESGAEVIGTLRSAVDRLEEAIAGAETATRGPAANGTSRRPPPTTPAAAASAMLGTNRSSALKEEQQVLKDLLTHLKSSIVRNNKEEEDSKKHNQGMIASLKLRLESDRAKMNQTNLSAKDREMYANDTRLEERELQYWTRGRELQHGMYHANLKMTHGLMSRVKTVMQAYEDVLTRGHLDPGMSKMLHAAATSISTASAPKADGLAKADAKTAVANRSAHKVAAPSHK